MKQYNTFKNKYMFTKKDSIRIAEYWMDFLELRLKEQGNLTIYNYTDAVTSIERLNYSDTTLHFASKIVCHFWVHNDQFKSWYKELLRELHNRTKQIKSHSK